MKVDLGLPSPRQYRFLTDTHKYIGFGGARGGGKSWAVRYKAKILAITKPGIRQMIVRKTYPELTENHIKPLTADLNCYATNKRDRIATYNDKNKELRFPNGSTILFRYCDNDKDAERFQGTEVDILYLDEATQYTEEIFKKLSACVRGTGQFPRRIYLTCNPGGVGHKWVKRLFIDRRYEKNENPDDYSFIKSLVTDNKVLLKNDPDYLVQLEALPLKLRKAWLEGDWDIFEGQFFEEFRDDPDHYKDRQYTHVIEPFAIPEGWKIYRSFDWGYSKPFSCAWWAIDYDGILYRIAELYGCTGEPNEGLRWTPDQVFKEIHRIETETEMLSGRKIIGIADPAIWAADTGKSIADVASEYYVHFIPGDHKRIPGWMQVHYRLRFDENGYPMMYVFKNCAAFIRTIPTLQYDKHRAEDLDTSAEDHVADEVRYMCMSRPIKPRAAKDTDQYATNPANLYLNIPKESLEKPRVVPRMEIIES